MKTGTQLPHRHELEDRLDAQPEVDAALTLSVPV